ncbi:MAG: phage holin family protein [Anaerolineae bacterium]|jgi:putative membrane protein
MKSSRFLRQFSWRFLLVRIVVNAIALAGTAAILPRIYYLDRTLWSWLLTAIVLGVLNALLKPILQFLTLRFIFVTYGLVVVLVNALLLWLLSLIFPNRFAVTSFVWLLLGGLVLGTLSSFLESLMGLTMPIVPDDPPGQRRQLEEQLRRVGSLAAISDRALAQEPTLATAGLEPHADARAPGASGPPGPGTQEPEAGSKEGRP